MWKIKETKLSKKELDLLIHVFNTYYHSYNDIKGVEDFEKLLKKIKIINEVKVYDIKK